MESPYTYLTEEERAQRRAQRAKIRARKQRERRRRQMMLLFPPLLLLTVVLLLLAFAREKEPPAEDTTPPEAPIVQMPEIPEEEAVPTATITADTVHLDDTFPSQYVVLIDQSSGRILAEKGYDTVISPASMTKIMTLLVAAEHVTDLDDTFTMTIEITDYCFINDCSVVGLDIGETVSVRELLYGCILPSGADASLGLAHYVAGSHEAFVELMNEKAEELGISATTHFTNCVGLYDGNHHCTVYDMAMILQAAMENELCREILDARSYETAPTEAHPDGQILSNWFLRRIEDKDTGDIRVVAAKTGYVVESGSCAASCGRDSDGNLFFCVTGDAESSWRAIYDHVDLYKTYCADPSAAQPAEKSA